ncbi:MAG: UDP-N-acetylmuramate--L-alanine ligase [Candidatus Onthomonas sp.]
MSKVSELKAMLKPGCRAHLVGIGGVSMYPLAEMLLSRGLIVSGSDMRDSDHLAHLRSQGVAIHLGHFPENIQGADLVIRTAAVHDDNPEIAAARAAGIPVFERAQALGALMSDYNHALCVSGTHGKTTTTSMCTHIVMQAGLDPTVMIGGDLPLLGCGYRIGRRDTIVLESCEYCNSFLSFRPTVAVVLNVEEDHMDFFHSLEEIQQSFRTFAGLVPEDGWVVYNADDANTVRALEGLDRKTASFGLDRPARFTAQNLIYQQGLARFDLIDNGQYICHIRLAVPGRHNVLNALAAAAAALCMGIDGAAIAAGLSQYKGAGRRFEYRGTCNGAKVYDDYAHHPGELKTLLTTAKTLGYNRVICAFQPHTYTRTIACFDGFVEQLSRPDKTVLMEIFPARETNTTGISSRDLAEKIPGAVYCATLEETEAVLRSLAQPGDLILTVGAGELNRVAGRLTAQAEDAR